MQRRSPSSRPSRLDIAGFECEDLRAGCPGMSAEDGWPGSYSSLDVATGPDT